MQGVLHALCNAHHLRELKAVVEIEKAEWARKVQKLLRRACHAVNLAHEQGVWLKPALVELFHREYDRILKKGLAFHEAQPTLGPTPMKGRKRRGRQRRRTGHNRLVHQPLGVIRRFPAARQNRAELAGFRARAQNALGLEIPTTLRALADEVIE